MNQAQMQINDLGIFALMANALAMQPLGHDPMERRERAPNAPATEPPAPRRGWLDRIDHWLWRLEQRAIERHLATATDIYDLEVKIRELERGARPWCY